MLTAPQYVINLLKERKSIPFSELEQILSQQPKMLGFGVKPQHVVQSMLQLGRVSYDEQSGIVQLRDTSREAMLRRGQEYLQLLVKDPQNAERLRLETPSLERDYLDSIRTIHRVHGYDKAKLIFT